MSSLSGDAVAGQRAVSSAIHPSKANGVAENVSDTPNEPFKYCQGEELEKIEGLSCKKDADLLKEHYTTNKSEKPRRRWSTEEDELLTQMVNKHGLKNWKNVACAIPDRNALQCQMRWRFTLDPAINKQAWTQEEELKLIRAHQTYGNKWLKMVKYFPGRTNYAIKEHWRGPMKRKLNSYLASGLLEQFSDFPENLPDSQNSDPDILSGSEGLSSRNLSSALPTSQKSKQGTSSKSNQGTSSKSKQGTSSKSKQGTSSESKQGCTELCENTDTSEGESSDIMYAKGLDAHSGQVNQRIVARSNEYVRARKRLAFLSSPVELKASTATMNPERALERSKQTGPAITSISPSNVCRDISGEAIPECSRTDVSPSGNYQPIRPGNYQPKHICSPETSDPHSVEQLHQANASDLLDMSYCDGLMIITPGSPHDDSSIYHAM